MILGKCQSLQSSTSESELEASAKRREEGIRKCLRLVKLEKSTWQKTDKDCLSSGSWKKQAFLSKAFRSVLWRQLNFLNPLFILVQAGVCWNFLTRDRSRLTLLPPGDVVRLFFFLAAAAAAAPPAAPATGLSLVFDQGGGEALALPLLAAAVGMPLGTSYTTESTI